MKGVPQVKRENSKITPQLKARTGPDEGARICNGEEDCFASPISEPFGPTPGASGQEGVGHPHRLPSRHQELGTPRPSLERRTLHNPVSHFHSLYLCKV